jgi:hypothetical protein
MYIITQTLNGLFSAALLFFVSSMFDRRCESAAPSIRKLV